MKKRLFKNRPDKNSPVYSEKPPFSCVKDFIYMYRYEWLFFFFFRFKFSSKIVKWDRYELKFYRNKPSAYFHLFTVGKQMILCQISLYGLSPNHEDCSSRSPNMSLPPPTTSTCLLLLEWKLKFSDVLSVKIIVIKWYIKFGV